MRCSSMINTAEAWRPAEIVMEGDEALAAAPIVDYFIYGHLDDEVSHGISPCPRLLVGKQTPQKHDPWRQAVDPMTGVAMTRTYGLMTPFDPKMKATGRRQPVGRCMAYPDGVVSYQMVSVSRILAAWGCGMLWHVGEVLERPSPSPHRCRTTAPGGTLRFLRVAVVLEDGSCVAYGDSAFEGGCGALGELPPAVPCFAFWRGRNEEVPRPGEPWGGRKGRHQEGEDDEGWY
eukprot:Skav209598  [mRNA]  locus=scaffold1607:353242:361103:- [translate_table: standard]